MSMSRGPGPGAPQAWGLAIMPAGPDDLPRILEIQRAAFSAECVLLGDWNIQPMVQTLAEVEQDRKTALILKAATADGAVVASIRARRGVEGVYIFKLSVDPAFQGRGVAKALVAAAEAALPSSRYWLFTRAGNELNVNLYLKLGYSIYLEKEDEENPAIRFAYFEKRVPGGGPRDVVER